MPPTPDEGALEIAERMRAAAAMKEAALDALRAEVRAAALAGFGGPYVVPV